MAQKLSCLPAAHGEERSHRDGALLLREVRVEGIEGTYQRHGAAGTQDFSSAEQAVVGLKSGPSNGAILKLQTDTVTIIRQLLAINHFAAGCFLLERSDAYRLARLPGAVGEDAPAVRTDVIGEGPLFAIGTGTFQPGKAHDDDDRQPPFHSAAGTVVQRFLAQISISESEVWQ